MKTSDIPVCPYFVDVGCTYEQDGHVQYNSANDVVVMLVFDNPHCDHIEELYVEAVQRLAGANKVLIAGQEDAVTIFDDEEFTLHVYTHRVVL